MVISHGKHAVPFPFLQLVTIFSSAYYLNLPVTYPKIRRSPEHAQTKKAPTEVGAFVYSSSKNYFRLNQAFRPGY